MDVLLQMLFLYSIAVTYVGLDLIPGLGDGLLCLRGVVGLAVLGHGVDERLLELVERLRVAEDGAHDHHDEHQQDDGEVGSEHASILLDGSAAPYKVKVNIIVDPHRSNGKGWKEKKATQI